MTTCTELMTTQSHLKVDCLSLTLKNQSFPARNPTV